jgi:hypothetical protein
MPLVPGALLDSSRRHIVVITRTIENIRAGMKFVQAIAADHL